MPSLLRASTDPLSWRQRVDARNLAFDAERRDAECSDRYSRCVYRDYQIGLAGHHRWAIIATVNLWGAIEVISEAAVEMRKADSH